LLSAAESLPCRFRRAGFWTVAYVSGALRSPSVRATLQEKFSRRKFVLRPLNLGRVFRNAGGLQIAMPSISEIFSLCVWREFFSLLSRTGIEEACCALVQVGILGREAKWQRILSRSCGWKILYGRDPPAGRLQSPRTRHLEWLISPGPIERTVLIPGISSPQSFLWSRADLRN
jgi:hypothetical protein